MYIYMAIYVHICMHMHLDVYTLYVPVLVYMHRYIGVLATPIIIVVHTGGTYPR